MSRELVCPRRKAEFEDTGKDYPSGVFCTACPGPMKGVIRPREVSKSREELLAEALLKVLVKAGVVTGEPMTGPELLVAAQDYCNS